MEVDVDCISKMFLGAALTEKFWRRTVALNPRIGLPMGQSRLQKNEGGLLFGRRGGFVRRRPSELLKRRIHRRLGEVVYIIRHYLMAEPNHNI